MLKELFIKSQKTKTLKVFEVFFWIVGGVLLPFVSYAASEGFPAREVFVQIFNFSVFILAFFFLLKNPIKTLFHKRQKDFLSFEEEAALWEKKKSEELEQWRKKLTGLESQERNIQKKAEEEGNRLIARKEEELKRLKAQLQKSSEFLIRLEEAKAKKDLLNKWKNKVAEGAALDLEKEAKSSSFQSHMLKRFLKQMESHL